MFNWVLFSNISLRKRSLSCDSIASPGTLVLGTSIKSKEDIPSIQELPNSSVEDVASPEPPMPEVNPAAALVGPYQPLNLFDFVDVRMIDFAHSTHRGLKDSTIHEGPDQGFLFGLDNFMKILNELAL